MKAGQDDNFRPVFLRSGVAARRRGGDREVLSLQYVASKSCDGASEFLLFPVMKDLWAANGPRTRISEYDGCD